MEETLQNEGNSAINEDRQLPSQPASTSFHTCTSRKNRQENSQLRIPGSGKFIGIIESVQIYNITEKMLPKSTFCGSSEELSVHQLS